jgi:hypothetical protein
MSFLKIGKTYQVKTVNVKGKPGSKYDYEWTCDAFAPPKFTGYITIKGVKVTIEGTLSEDSKTIKWTEYHKKAKTFTQDYHYEAEQESGKGTFKSEDGKFSGTIVFNK